MAQKSQKLGRRQPSGLGYGRKPASAFGKISLLLFLAEAVLFAVSVGMSAAARGKADTRVGALCFAACAMSVAGLVLAAAGFRNRETRHGTCAAGMAANAAVLVCLCLVFVSGV